jgi:GDP-L-fucose synthase
MNIGLGFDHSINEYYEAVARAVGWDGEFTYDIKRPVGMKQKLVSV